MLRSAAQSVMLILGTYFVGMVRFCISQQRTIRPLPFSNFAAVRLCILIRTILLAVWLRLKRSSISQIWQQSRSILKNSIKTSLPQWNSAVYAHLSPFQC